MYSERCIAAYTVELLEIIKNVLFYIKLNVEPVFLLEQNVLLDCYSNFGNLSFLYCKNGCIFSYVTIESVIFDLRAVLYTMLLLLLKFSM